MSWLSDKLEEAQAQINPFDKGRTASTVRSERVKAPPAQTIKAAPLPPKAPDNRGLASKLYDQVNVFDNNRTFKQAAPTQSRSNIQQLRRIGSQTVDNVIKPALTQAGRAGTMINETPVGRLLGHPSQSSVIEGVARRQTNPEIANVVRQKGYEDLLNRTGIGINDSKPTIFRKAVSDIGGTAANFVPVGNAAKVAAGAVSPTIKSVASVANQSGVAGAVGSGLGAARDTTNAKDIAKSALIGYGAGAAVPVVGAGVRASVKAAPAVTTKLVDYNAKVGEIGMPRQYRLGLEDRRALADYTDYLSPNSGYSPTTSEASRLIAQVMEIGRRTGIDVTSGSPQDRYLRIGDFLENFDTQKQSMLQGGYVKLPGNANDDLVKKVFRSGTDDNSLYHGTKYDNAIKILEDGRIRASKPNSSRELKLDPKNGQVSLSRQRNSGFYNGASSDVKFVVDNDKIGKTRGYVDGELKPSDYTNPSGFEAESQIKKDIPLKAIKRVEGGPLLEPADEAILRDLASKNNIPFIAFDDADAMRKILPKKSAKGGQTQLPKLIASAERNVFDQNPLNPELSSRPIPEPYARASDPATVRTSRKAPQPPETSELSGGHTPNSPSGAKNRQSLPEYNTKKVGTVDKVFRSTRSIIERQGESGKKLASMLQGSRDTQELHLADLQKRLPTVRKLKGKDFENFVDATQGLAKPNNDKVARAVQEWQATHPGIRERAVAAGLDVGDLGAEYYPHFIDYDKVFKDKNTYNQAINHLVKTGQATTPEEAIKLLSHARDVSRNREFGNLEASRLIDLPFYDRTPNSLMNYLSGSAKRIAQTETFGKSDENALELIKKIGLEGGDTEAAKNAYDIAVGAKRYNPATEKASRVIRQYITTTRLGLGAITNISQNVNTGIVTGHMRTLGAMLKQLDPKTREFVGDTGVIADAVLQDLRSAQGDTFSSKVWGTTLQKITAPGFNAVEKFNRSVSATAGRDYALRLAQKGDEKTLRKLGVTGEIKDKTLTEAQQIQAARKIVEKTQFKVDAQDLPGWVDSPGGKLVAQFRSFSYNQGKFFSNEVVKPAAKGNLMPLARLLAAMPVGYALAETKRSINNRPSEENELRKGVEAFGNIGGAGLAVDMFRSMVPLNGKYLPSDRRVSMATSAFGGPTAGLGVEAVGAISEAIQKKNVPDEGVASNKLPVYSGEDQYYDPTQLARFGMRQIPIVGSRLQNSTLPYKEREDAESPADSFKEGLGNFLGVLAKPFTGSASAASEEKPANIKEAVRQANKSSKNKQEDFKSKFSKDDYDLYKLNETERKDIVRSGLVPQSKFDGLDKYADRMKKELGMATKEKVRPEGLSKDSRDFLDKHNDLEDDVKNKIGYEQNDYDYKLAKAKFEEDSLKGKISKAEMINRKAALKKEEVGAGFTKDTREYYNSLSKDEVYNLVTTDGNGQKIENDILAYGDALVKAGLIEKNKFRDKYGRKSISSSKGGSKRKKSNYDFTKDLFANTSSTSVTKSLRRILEDAMKA